MMISMIPGAPQEVVLQVFKGCLDTAAQAMVDLERERKPNITVQEVKGKIGQEFMRDQSDFFRKAWRAVQLRGGERLTSKGWMSFKSAFELAKLKVLDRTEMEEVEQLFRQLPVFWQRKVREEEDKLRKRQQWVRVGPLKE